MFRYVAAAAAALLLGLTATVASSTSHEEAPRQLASGCCRNLI